METIQDVHKNVTKQSVFLLLLLFRTGTLLYINFTKYILSAETIRGNTVFQKIFYCNICCHRRYYFGTL